MTDRHASHAAEARTSFEPMGSGYRLNATLSRLWWATRWTFWFATIALFVSMGQAKRSTTVPWHLVAGGLLIVSAAFGVAHVVLARKVRRDGMALDGAELGRVPSVFDRASWAHPALYYGFRGVGFCIGPALVVAAVDWSAGAAGIAAFLLAVYAAIWVANLALRSTLGSAQEQALDRR